MPQNNDIGRCPGGSIDLGGRRRCPGTEEEGQGPASRVNVDDQEQRALDRLQLTGTDKTKAQRASTRTKRKRTGNSGKRVRNSSSR